MKFISNREEVAQALNYGKYPVVTINCVAAGDDIIPVIEGGAVNVLTHKHNGKDWYERCRIEIFKDEYNNDGRCHVSIKPAILALTDTFGVDDVLEMATYANAPKLKKGDTVAFVLVGAKKKAAYVILADVKAVFEYNQISATLEDGASSTIAKYAWELTER